MLRFWSRDSGVTCGSCIRRIARLTAKPDTAIIKPIPLSIIEYGTLISVFMFFFKKSEMLALLTDVRTIRTPSIITVKIHVTLKILYIYILHFSKNLHYRMTEIYANFYISFCFFIFLTIFLTISTTLINYWLYWNDQKFKTM